MTRSRAGHNHVDVSPEALKGKLPGGLCLIFVGAEGPALTHEVLSGLQQVAIASRRDIDQREATVRDRYQITAAQTDAAAIAASPSLLQPITATRLWLTDQTGAVQPVLTAALDSFVPAIVLSTASATYALAGLFLGSLIANPILAAARGSTSKQAVLF